MALSPDAVFSKLVRWIPRRPAFVVTAVWTGSQMAAFSLLVPEFFMSGLRVSPETLWLVFMSPMLLASGWMCPNLFVIAFALIRFSQPENLDVRSWAAFAGIESVFCMLALPSWVGAGWGAVVALAVWGIQIAMLATAAWFFRQWQVNRWAGEMALLRAENDARRARRERRGPGDAWE